jgi:hypothetical protein
MYTDNVELATSEGLSDLSYDIQPHLVLSHSAPRLSYNLGVLAGFLVNKDLPGRNQSTQSAALDVSYGLAQFVTLRVSDSFTNSTGLWNGTNTVSPTDAGAGIGAVQQANPALLTYGRFRTNTALADLTAQLTRTSYAGARASQTYLWFPTAVTDPVVGTLFGGQSYSAELFYNHQFTARNWGGITGRVQRFDLSQSEGRTDTTSVLFFYAATLRPHMTLSLFGGPEFSITSPPAAESIPANSFARRMWSPAAGAVFDWQGPRTAGSISYSRQINNSAGLSSAVTLSGVEAELTRRVGRLTVGPGFGFTENIPIVANPTLRTYSGRGQLNYRIGNSTIGGGYARDNRSAVGSNLSASANRVWISYSYDFLRPLGR